MASSQASQASSTLSSLMRGRDHQRSPSGSPRPRHRSESARLSDRQPIVESGAADKHRLCLGARECDPVQVFSRTFNKCVDVKATKFVGDDLVRVEFEVDGHWCGKTLHSASEHLTWALPSGSSDEEVDPGATFTSESESRPTLQHVTIQQQDAARRGLLCAKRSPTFTEARQVDVALAPQGGLKFYQNNSFYVKTPLDGPCKIQYTFLTEGTEDVLIKVYARTHNAKCDRFDDWQDYELVGYIHSEECRDAVEVQQAGSYFLGIVVHRELNIDKETLQANHIRSTGGGWEGREEVPAQKTSQGTDFMISRRSSNNDENNSLLRRMTKEPVRGPHGNRPITFCTDRSLGLGQHFEQEEHQATLHLGKHGFGQSMKKGEWFEEYKKHAKLVNCGILVINPNIKYFGSGPCRKEILSFKNYPVYYYDPSTNSILEMSKAEVREVAANACKEDPEVVREKVLQALKEAWPEPLRTQKLEEACGFTKAMARKTDSRPKSWLNPILYRIPEIERINAIADGKPLWALKKPAH